MKAILAKLKAPKLPDLPTLIIIAALLVSAPRLAAALSFVEPAFLGLPIELLTGPAFGLSTAGATVYVWDVYKTSRKNAKLRNLLPWGWGFLLFAIAVILTPGMVVELRKSELADLLPFPLDVAWCAFVAIVSEGIVALVAIALSIATLKAKPEKQEPAESKPQAKASVHQCDRCGATSGKSGKPFGSKQAVNAHKRGCTAKIEKEI